MAHSFTTFFLVLNQVMATISRNRNQPLLFASFTIGKNIVEASLSLSLIILLHQTWNGRISATILAPIIMAIPIIFVLRKWGYIQSFSRIENIRRILFVSA